MPRATQYPNGVSNALANSFEDLAAFPFPDLTRWHLYYEEFDYYTAGDWTITGTNAGTPALTDADGGVLTLANTGAVDNDGTFIQKDGESFVLGTDRSWWFKVRCQLSEVIQSDLIAGLAITDASPLDASDGVFFRKDDGAATVDLVIVAGSTETVVEDVATLVDATDVELAFHYDANRGTLRVYVDDAEVDSTQTFDNLTAEELTITFGVQNGEAAAKNALCDYLLACVERP